MSRAIVSEAREQVDVAFARALLPKVIGHPNSQVFHGTPAISTRSPMAILGIPLRCSLLYTKICHGNKGLRLADRSQPVVPGQ